MAQRYAMCYFPVPPPKSCADESASLDVQEKNPQVPRHGKSTEVEGIQEQSQVFESQRFINSFGGIVEDCLSRRCPSD